MRGNVNLAAIALLALTVQLGCTSPQSVSPEPQRTPESAANEKEPIALSPSSVSLESIISRASKVMEVEVLQTQDLDGQLRQTQAYGVDLMRLEGLHPDVAEPEEITLLQFKPIALPVLETSGQGRAILFLGEVSDAGLTPIVGQQAGYFRPVRSETDAELELDMVVNLIGNHRLWAESLWSDQIPRESVALNLESLVMHRGLSDPARVIDLILEEYADQPLEPRPIPRDLVRAAVMAYKQNP